MRLHQISVIRSWVFVLFLKLSRRSIVIPANRETYCDIFNLFNIYVWIVIVLLSENIKFFRNNPCNTIINGLQDSSWTVRPKALGSSGSLNLIPFDQPFSGMKVGEPQHMDFSSWKNKLESCQLWFTIKYLLVLHIQLSTFPMD